MVTKGMLLGQVVVLLVNACHVLCLHPRMGQVLRRWQHFLPNQWCCQGAACYRAESCWRINMSGSDRARRCLPTNSKSGQSATTSQRCHGV